LIRQPRKVSEEVACLKAESFTERIKMKELMDMYSDTLDLEKISEITSMPLHKQLKNLYRKNRGF
jgi:hypothetical protein